MDPLLWIAYYEYWLFTQGTYIPEEGAKEGFNFNFEPFYRSLVDTIEEDINDNKP